MNEILWDKLQCLAGETSQSFVFRLYKVTLECFLCNFWRHLHFLNTCVLFHNLNLNSLFDFSFSVKLNIFSAFCTIYLFERRGHFLSILSVV